MQAEHELAVVDFTGCPEAEALVERPGLALARVIAREQFGCAVGPDQVHDLLEGGPADPTALVSGPVGDNRR